MGSKIPIHQIIDRRYELPFPPTLRKKCIDRESDKNIRLTSVLDYTKNE